MGEGAARSAADEGNRLPQSFSATKIEEIAPACNFKLRAADRPHPSFADAIARFQPGVE
jgi:hypothetical protein